MSEIHPALEAAQNSWRCVQAHDKEGWLALMSDDICIEDPIGVAPTNPRGEGVRGKQAVSAFYDKNIASSKMLIVAHESMVGGTHESAHIMTLSTTLANGVTTHVHGIFTYRIDDDGKLANLRGYWTFADNMTVEHPEHPEKAGK
jgi:steroid delta-isomerase